MIFYKYFLILFYVFVKRALQYKFQNRARNEILNKLEANNVKCRVWEVTRRHLKRKLAVCKT